MRTSTSCPGSPSRPSRSRSRSPGSTSTMGQSSSTTTWSTGPPSGKIFFTRSRPYKKNDQGDDRVEEQPPRQALRVLLALRRPRRAHGPESARPVVNDRLNFFTPTKKPVEWGPDRLGRRKRIYDEPKTPFARLLDAGSALTGPGTRTPRLSRRPESCRAGSPDPVAPGRLTAIAKRPTLDLEASLVTPVPDTSRGVKLRPAS